MDSLMLLVMILLTDHANKALALTCLVDAYSGQGFSVVEVSVGAGEVLNGCDRVHHGGQGQCCHYRYYIITRSSHLNRSIIRIYCIILCQYHYDISLDNIGVCLDRHFDHLKMESMISLKFFSVVSFPCSPPIRGLYSTISILHQIPNSSKHSLNALKNWQAVSFLIPLGAIVPVEGMSIGSMPSMSKLTWTTSIPCSFNHLKIYLQSSSVFTTLMPLSLIRFSSYSSTSLMPQQMRFYVGRVLSQFTHSKVLSIPQTKLRGIPWQFLVFDTQQVFISAWASTQIQATFFPTYFGLLTTESTVLIASE